MANEPLDTHETLNPSPNKSTVTTGLSRRNVLLGTAWAVPTVMLSQAVPAFAASPDYCAPAGSLFDTDARGKLIAGTLLNQNFDAETLDGVAEVYNAIALERTGGASFVEVSSPLGATALNALSVDLGGVSQVVTDLLDSLLGADVGAINQYAYAHEQPGLVSSGSEVGYTLGASGAVNQSNGALSLSHQADAGAPQLGSLNLHAVLQQLLQESPNAPGVSALVSALVNLDLQIGAVAGYARLDTLCQTPAENELDRDYTIAYLRLLLESDTVIQNLVTPLINAIDGLTIDTAELLSVITTALGPIGTLLGNLLNQTLQVTLTLNSAQLTAQPIPAEQPAALQVDLADGTVVIDVESILGGMYDGQSEKLNGQPANTRLFVDVPIPSNSITTVLRQWILDSLIDRIKDLLYVKVQLGSSGGIAPTYLLLEGTLRQFLEGNATATLRVAGLSVPGFGNLVNGLLGGVGNLVVDTLGNLLAPSGGLNTVFDGVNVLLQNLFTVLTQVLAIWVNRQWETPQDPAYLGGNKLVQSPRYHEAALSIEAVGLLNLLDLRLATGFAGHHTQRA